MVYNLLWNPFRHACDKMQKLYINILFLYNNNITDTKNGCGNALYFGFFFDITLQNLGRAKDNFLLGCNHYFNVPV